MVQKSKLPQKEETNKIALFEGDEIRRVLINGEWYFSVVDVVGVLSESPDPNNYWKVLKHRLREEGSEKSVTNCNQLKMPSKKDGKEYLTDIADTETMFRIIQSVPSKKAEPFKRWLARVGKERLDEIEQPEKAIERGKGYYLAKGYSQQWVETRTASIDTRKQFTDTLKDHGIKEGYQYAVLTNELYSSSFGLDANEYKEYKGLDKKASLRDHMTPLEFIVYHKYHILGITIDNCGINISSISCGDKIGTDNDIDINIDSWFNINSRCN